MRRLSAEERGLWEKVVASARPFHAAAISVDEPAGADVPQPSAVRPQPPIPAKPPTRLGQTLDGSWDRRLGRGLVQPDAMLDLHGHGLDAAYGLIDRRLEMAIASGARALLLVTGKAPAAGSASGRGRIRAAVGDWLAASRHAGDIAAVRGAHPRHGGAGALYIVLRKRRSR